MELETMEEGREAQGEGKRIISCGELNI